MLAQWANSYQLQIPFKQVDKHRQFINPVFTQELAKCRYTEIVFKLAALIKIILLVHVLLEIFRIGIHCTHLIYIDQLAVLTFAKHLEDNTVRGHMINQWLFDLMK